MGGNRHAANLIRWAMWIDRDLLDAFRRAVPRGEQQEFVRRAMQAAVDAREGENGSTGEETGDRGVASSADGAKQTRRGVASNLGGR